MKIDIVLSDSWQTLYLNGELKLEDVELQLTDIIKTLGHYSEIRYADKNWIEKVGKFPKDIKDVKFE